MQGSTSEEPTNCGSTSMDSTNFGLCSTELFTTEKKIYEWVCAVQILSCSRVNLHKEASQFLRQSPIVPSVPTISGLLFKLGADKLMEKY